MAKEKRYNNAEIKAYYFGLGVGVGQRRKVKSTMDSIPAPLKESFKNGLDRGILNSRKPVFKNKKSR